MKTTDTNKLEKVNNMIEKLRAEVANKGAEAYLNANANKIRYYNGKYDAYDQVIEIIKGELE